MHGGQIRDWLLNLQLFDVGVGGPAPDHVGLKFCDTGVRHSGHIHGGGPRGHALVRCQLVEIIGGESWVHVYLFDDVVFEGCIKELLGRIVDSLNRVGKHEAIYRLVVGEIQIVGGGSVDGVIFCRADYIGKIARRVQDDSKAEAGVVDYGMP